MNHVEVVYETGLRLKQYADKPMLFMLACLLHDIGNSFCTLRKVTESEYMGETDPVKQSSLKGLMVAYRDQHHNHSAIQAREVCIRLGLPIEYVYYVQNMVIDHDGWRYGNQPFNNDTRLLRGADVSWMLNVHGIQRDLARQKEYGLRVYSVEEMYAHNLKVVQPVLDTVPELAPIIEEYKVEIFGK